MPFAAIQGYRRQIGGFLESVEAEEALLEQRLCDTESR